MKKYYDLLQLGQGASLEEAKSAYKKQIKKYHPDLYPGDKSFAESKTAEINEAYDLIVEDIKKKEEAARYEARQKLYGNIKTVNDLKKSKTTEKPKQEKKQPAKKVNKVKEFFDNVLDPNKTKESQQPKTEPKIEPKVETKKETIYKQENQQLVEEYMRKMEEAEALEKQRQYEKKLEEERRTKEEEARKQEEVLRVQKELEKKQEEDLWNGVKEDIKCKDIELNVVFNERQEEQKKSSYYTDYIQREFEYAQSPRKRNELREEDLVDVYADSPEEVARVKRREKNDEKAEKTLTFTIVFLLSVALLLAILAFIN